MIWGILLLGLFGLFAEGQSVPGPSEFYVVSEFFSDNGALLYYRVIDVKPDGPDALVRYIRVAPLNVICARRVIVQARETRVRNSSPADLAGPHNPCSVNAPALKKALKRYRQRAGYLEAISFGIVAHCGSQTTALGLPIAEGVKLDGLKHSHPEMESLWDLTSAIVKRAFGEKDIFNEIPEAEDVELQRSGAGLVPSLTSGEYDEGLAEATKGGVSKWKKPSFRKLLESYGGVVPGGSLFTPQLVNAGSYQFSRYVAPIYPALAKSAYIEDKFQLELSISPETGEVVDVEPVSGHPMLMQSAITAAKQWRFEPGSVDSKSVNVVLDYALRCP